MKFIRLCTGLECVLDEKANMVYSDSRKKRGRKCSIYESGTAYRAGPVPVFQKKSDFSANINPWGFQKAEGLSGPSLAGSLSVIALRHPQSF